MKYYLKFNALDKNVYIYFYMWTFLSMILFGIRANIASIRILLGMVSCNKLLFKNNPKIIGENNCTNI